MFLLDLDPNVVKPGWTPLIITILLAAALVFLYLSMRRQFRRINVNPIEDDVDAGAEGNAGPEGSVQQPQPMSRRRAGITLPSRRRVRTRKLT